MVTAIPPDLLGVTGPAALPLNPGTPFPAPTAGPGQMAGMVMGQLGGPGAGMMLGGPPPTDPAMDLGDPVMAGMLALP